MEIVGVAVVAVFMFVGMLVFIGGILAMSALLRGWVLSILWRWFMVPTLGLPVLSIPQAIGIVLVFDILTTYPSYHHPKREDEKTNRTIVVRFAEPLLVPFIVLLIGWVVRQYM